jgi:hypothetical protein
MMHRSKKEYFMRRIALALLFSATLAGHAWADATPAQTSLDQAGNIDLQVSGTSGLKVAGQNTACDQTSAGAIRFNHGAGIFEGCNGIAWLAFDDATNTNTSTSTSTTTTISGTCPSGNMVTGVSNGAWSAGRHR